METIILAQNLHKMYGKGSTSYEALRGIHLEVVSGESVAIEGKSGSGKSTLMHCLAGLDTPTEGTISVHGQLLSHMGDRERTQLRSRVFGFIFQQFFLQPYKSVRENVMLPLAIQGITHREQVERAHDMIQRVGLEDRELYKAVDLSGGQKQRVAIARALVTNPEVIFADEPTGNLDTETGTQIMDMLFGLQKTSHVSLIIVTHDADVAALCDRTIYIQDGSIRSI